MHGIDGGRSAASLELAGVTRLQPTCQGLEVGIDRISLLIPCGESLAMVGSEDSGTATLVAATSGMEGLDAGSIRIEGRSPEPGDLVNMNAGLLLPGETVKQSLVTLLDVKHRLRLSRRRAHSRAKQAFEVAGCPRLLPLKPDELSRVEMASALLAIALALEPRAVVAHEPDRDLRHADAHRLLERLVSAATSGGCALLYTTRYLSHAKGDQLWLMRRGEAIDLLAPRPALRVLA